MTGDCETTHRDAGLGQPLERPNGLTPIPQGECAAEIPICEKEKNPRGHVQRFASHTLINDDIWAVSPVANALLTQRAFEAIFSEAPVSRHPRRTI